MSPLQKLVRLRQIRDGLDKTGSSPELIGEIESILDSVGNPPAELVNSNDGHAWATAFAESVPGVTVEQAFSWFSAALIAGHDVGRQVGHDEALENAKRAQAVGVDLMVGVLRDIRRLNLAGDIHSKRFLYNDIVSTLPELIERTLRNAGYPHE